MKYRRFQPLHRDLSLLALGSMVFKPDADENSFALLDAWREAGGNLLDSAHLYNGGHAERVIGQWMASRGCREEVVILTKGAHHNVDRNRVTPEDIASDLRDSLARLRVESVDLYLLHRDDRTVPVGEIVDALNQHQRARRILAFGASNWSPERMDEANAYAAAHGLAGFTCSSPNLSLAVPNEEIWPGCLSACGPEAWSWYAERRMTTFAWSSQARGYFSGRFTPENVADDAFMERVYASSDNWERLRRATELGAKRGFSAIEVALAWVLHQPFPVHALIGPATVAELHSSLRALELELSAKEFWWLDLIE